MACVTWHMQELHFTQKCPKQELKSRAFETNRKLNFKAHCVHIMWPMRERSSSRTFSAPGKTPLWCAVNLTNGAVTHTNPLPKSLTSFGRETDVWWSVVGRVGLQGSRIDERTRRICIWNTKTLMMRKMILLACKIASHRFGPQKSSHKWMSKFFGVTRLLTCW